MTQPQTDATRAEWMRYRLNDLLANPYSLLPSYQQRYETLLKYAQSLTPQQAYGFTMLLGKDNGRLFPDMPDTAELNFPGANAVDLSTQVGWYYFAGTCTGTDGREYGVLCMFFRYALLPPAMAQHFGLTALDVQVVDVQLALSVGGGDFHQIDPPLIIGTSGQLRVGDKLYLAAGDNLIEASGGDSLFPLRVRAGGVDHAGGQGVPLAIDFTLTSGGPYLLQGLDGAMPLVGGIGTRYYSIPHLALDPATSRIEIGGRQIALSGGTLWFDHQWGAGMAPTGAPRHASMRAAANLGPASVPGWEFFALNLDGARALTFNSIHSTASLPYIHQTGPQPPSTLNAVATGKYMDQFGTTFMVSGSVTIDQWRKTGDAPNPAKYPNVPTWVPHHWTLTIMEPVVPERLRKLRLETISDDAQAPCFANGTRYVEAACNVFDAAGAKTGSGYAEAVGYVDALPTQLGLAGLPVTPEMIALFRPPAMTLELFLESLWYMLQPANKNEFDRLIKCGSLPLPARPTDCGTPAPMPPSPPIAGLAASAEEILQLIRSRLGALSRGSV